MTANFGFHLFSAPKYLSVSESIIRKRLHWHLKSLSSAGRLFSRLKSFVQYIEGFIKLF